MPHLLPPVVAASAALLLTLPPSFGASFAPEARLVFPVPNRPADRQALHLRAFPLRQTSPRPFVYSVEARGEGLAPSSVPGHRTFGIELRIDYADGTRKWLMPKATLSPAATDWQTLTDVFVPPRPVSNVVFYCRLAQKGAATFRGVSVDDLPPDVAHGPCSIRETDGFLVLSNDFVRLRLDPANGGTGVSLVDLKTGVDYASEDRNFRLLMDRFRSGGKSWKRAYAATVMKDTSEEIAVSLKLTAPDGFPYVEIEKIVRLMRDSSAVDVAFRYRNLPESMGEQVLEPWFKNAFVPRGAKEQTLILPTASGVRTWGGSSGDCWPTNAIGGWMGGSDGQSGTLVAEFDPAYFADSYLWLGGRDQYTAEWCFQPVAIPAGGTFETHVSFLTLGGMVRPDWCENGIAATFVTAKTLAVRLFSARSVIVAAELETTGRGGENTVRRRILKLSPEGVVDWPTDLSAENLAHVRLRLCSDGRDVFEAERAFVPGFIYRSRKPKAKPAELKPFKLTVSDEVKSPATAFARPFAGGRLRVLFIVELRQQREIVELMERMDLEPRTIRIGSNKNAGAWGMIEGFGTYSYSDANRSLKCELADPVDAIVVSGSLWEHVDRENRADILAKSRAGTGLVVIDDKTVIPDDFASDAAGDAYVTGSVPRELLPFGADRLTARSSGKSRAVFCEFRAYGGLTPFVGYSQVEPPFRYQDYSLGVLARALVWTAHRDLARTPDLRRTEESIEPEPGLKISHVRYLSPTGVVDWACEVRHERQPVTITSFNLASDVTVVGGTVTGTVAATGGTVEVTLRDGFGRLLSAVRAATDGTFRLPVPEARTSALAVTAELKLESRPCARRRATVICRRSPQPDAFAFAIGEETVSAHAKRYLDPLRFSRYRDLGVNQLRFWRIEQDAVLRAFATAGFGFDFPVGSLRIGSRVFPKEFAEPYARTKLRRYLCRKPCLHDASWWTNLVATAQKRIHATAKYSPVSYDCGDENSLTLWATPFDFCFSEPTLAAFRDWLCGQYGSLTALNDSWGTAFPDWASVVPDTTEEARERAKRTGRRAYGAWADHRRFMELSFADFYRRLKGVMNACAPDVPFDMSGTQQPNGWTGMDMWLVGQIIDIPAAYDHAELAEIVRSFGHPLVKPWYGYGHSGASQRYRIWHDAFRFRNFGVSFYSGNSILMPDFTTPAPVADIVGALADLRTGGARLLASLVAEESVLVHYSQASIHAAQIEGRYPAFVAARERLVKRLNAADLAYRFVAYAELEDGVLDRVRAKTVILPQSFALSDAECAALRRFASRGGKVVGTAECGLFDEHCRLRQTNPVADILSPDADFGPDPKDGVRLFRFKVAGNGEGSYFGFVRSLDARGESVRTVRLDVPSFVHDLRRKRSLGRIREFPVSLAPGEAAFFAALPYEIRSLAVEAPVRLTPGGVARIAFRLDAGSTVTAPHPVRVAVYRPDGTAEPLYGGVADTRDGRGAFDFRFALDDPPGDWRIVLTDFISGKSAAAVLRLDSPSGTAH